MSTTSYALLPDSPLVCQVIPQLFTPQECADLLTNSIQQSFQQAHTHYPTYYRNNDRLVVDSLALAEWLFAKVRPYVPEVLEIQSVVPTEAGTWQIQELNARLRFCRYGAHQYFHRHLDGVHYRSEAVQSKLTFMIYLNGSENFTGGRTLFFKDKDTSDIWAAYTPQQGDMIVFDHTIWHEGEELLSGEKFVLRSDILYTRISTLLIPSLQQPYAEGHLGYIWTLHSWNASTLLSAGRDCSIKVWNEHGQCIQRLTGHENSVLCLAKLTDTHLLSGSRDQTIRIWKWQADGFTEVRVLRLHQAVVLSLCRLSDTLFASSGGEGHICITTSDGTLKHKLRYHTDWVWQVLPLSETRLASCSEDGTVAVWDWHQEKVLHTWQNPHAVLCIAYHPQTDLLAVGDLKGILTLLHVHLDGQLTQIVQIPDAHAGIIRTLQFTSSGLLASGSEDNRVKIWDLTTHTCLATYTHANFVQALALSTNGRLHSASYDGQIRQWDVPAPYTSSL